MDIHKLWIRVAYAVAMLVSAGLVWRKPSGLASALEDTQLHLFQNAADRQLLSSLDQYELVYTSFPEDGNFMRQSNGIYEEEADALQIRLEGTDTELDLDLELNRDLTRAGVRLRHVTKDGTFDDVQKPRCHYQGVVRGVAQSGVSLSTCNGIRGSIATDGDHFVIKPLSQTSNQTHQLHVLYKVKSDEGNDEDLVDLQNLPDISVDELFPQTTSAKHRRVRRDVESEVKYLELAMFCSSSMINRYGGINSAFVRALDIVNAADMLYRPMNVRLVLTFIELWEEGEDPITISDNLHVTLENFYQYVAASNSTDQRRFDAAHLVLGTNIVGSLSYYGTSKQNSICTEKAASLSQDFDEATTPAVLARVIAHNLYIYNDDFYTRGVRRCTCDGKATGCVMYQRPTEWNPKPPTEFSQCSVDAFLEHLQEGFYPCLFNVPETHELVSFGVCGNGIVETSETCDCGTPEECGNDPCCDPTTCQLTDGSECHGGECCSNCQFVLEGTQCRESIGECDVPETCTGTSGLCPENIYMQDGTSCRNDTGYCYNGRCPTRDDQCEDIWGEGAESADDCFTLNTLARYPLGYCGYTISDTLTYLGCTSGANSATQRRCGLLHCGNAALSFFPYGLNLRGNSFGVYCTSMWVTDLTQSDIVNPGDVADGTKCDDGMVCLDFDCVPVEALGFSPCPTDLEGSICSGNGVCTSKDECLCSQGWTGPACNETAATPTMTAMVDDSNATTPNDNASFPPPPPSIPPPFPTTPNGTEPEPTTPFPPPPPSIPPPFPTTPNTTELEPTTPFPPPPPSIPPPFPTAPNVNESEPTTLPPPPPSIPPPFPTTPNGTELEPTTPFPPPPPSIPPPFPTTPNGTELEPTTPFPPPPPSIPPPFPTTLNGTELEPTTPFPPPPPSIPPPFPTTPNDTEPEPTTPFPPPPPSIPPPFPTTPNDTEPEPTTPFPPPPPSIPPPFPTTSNDTEPEPTTPFPPPPPSNPPPFPTTPNDTEPEPTTPFPPPPPSIPPPFPTSPNDTEPEPTTPFPPPPPSIPPPFPTSPNDTEPEPTTPFPPPPPSIPPPFPTSPNDTEPEPTTPFPPPPPSIPPPFPTTPNDTEREPTTPFPPPPPSIPPPFPTTPNDTEPEPTTPFPPPPPSIPPPFPTTPNVTEPEPTTPFPPPPPSIPPPFPTTPNGTEPEPTTPFPPPPPSIPPPFPTSPNATEPEPTTIFPPPPPSIPPPFPTTPNATEPESTTPIPPPPSIPPPFPTPFDNTTMATSTTQPSTQFPSTQLSSTQPPFTQFPSTQQPSTQFPPTQFPSTQQPSTQPPFTQFPSTQQPSTQFPSTQFPSTQPPTTRFPSTQQPSTQPSTTYFPSTQQPSTQPPTTRYPSTQQPSTQPPTTRYPSTQQPSTQFPSTRFPSTQQPSTRFPSSQQPSTQFPSTRFPSTQQPSTQPPFTRPFSTRFPSTPLPTTYLPSTRSPLPGYILANLKITILDAQNSPLYDTSVRVNIAGGESKPLMVPEMTNVIDVISLIPQDGSLGVVVSKTGYTSNAIRWSFGETEEFQVKLSQLKEATVEMLGGEVLIETDFNAYGQKAMFQFDPALIGGTAINAAYVLTSDLSLIPATMAAPDDSNTTPVELRALGALELTITGQQSGEEVPVDGSIDMMVPLEQGLGVKDGAEIGIWTYNETTAFWEEVGTGTIVITQDLLVYWSFTAPHLSWWMAAERVDKATTPKPASGTTRDPGKSGSNDDIFRTQWVVYVMVGVLLVLPLVIMCVCLIYCMRRKNKKRRDTKGTLPVKSSEMEIEMHPQSFTNKAMTSDTVAVEVNDNDIAVPTEAEASVTRADIQFSTFSS